MYGVGEKCCDVNDKYVVLFERTCGLLTQLVLIKDMVCCHPLTRHPGGERFSGRDSRNVINGSGNALDAECSMRKAHVLNAIPYFVYVVRGMISTMARSTVNEITRSCEQMAPLGATRRRSNRTEVISVPRARTSGRLQAAMFGVGKSRQVCVMVRESGVGDNMGRKRGARHGCHKGIDRMRAASKQAGGSVEDPHISG